MRRSLGLVLFLAVLAACGGGSDDAGSTASCETVTSKTLLDAVPIVASSAVKAEKLGNGHAAWYVSSADGATWVTDADPHAEDSGLILPMNAKARAASDVGVDVSPTARLYGETSSTSSALQKSQACASGQG